MLPIKPQSVFCLFYEGFNTYKKLFVPIFPIAGLFGSMQLIGRTLVGISTLWVAISSIIFFILSFLCFCWGVCFVYEYLSSNKIDYKSSLTHSLERSFRAAFLFISGLVVSAILAILVIKGRAFIPQERVILSALYSSFIIILFVPVLCSIFISIFEVLIKNQDFLSSIKKAFNVAFDLEFMWRFLAFFLLMLLLAVLVFIPVFILVLVLNKFGLNAKYVLATGMFFGFMLLTLVWIPLKMILVTYLYNDFMLRFEGRKK